MNDAVDVGVRSPFTEKGLDEVIQGLPGAAAVVEGWRGDQGEYRVRCFGGSAGFIRFAVENQGYGSVLYETTELA
jgi:hypothetical protein